ncbi:MAG: hypothetical protein FWC79_03350 [Oscillospiraceae bacterium]|nr:hypothetical protein [Oscillospiraceae bacterium]
MGDDGVNSMNPLLNFTDDGSASSKQLLMKLHQDYQNLLSNYKESLDEKYKRETDRNKRDRQINQEMEDFQSMIEAQFFPQVVALQKKIRQEELSGRSKGAKGNQKEDPKKGKKDGKDKKDRKDMTQKEKDEDLTNRLQGNKKEDGKKPEEKKADKDDKNKPVDIKKEPKPKSNKQVLIEKLEQSDPEMSVQSEIVAQLGEDKANDLDNLNDEDKKILSSIIKKKFDYAYYKSAQRDNPGYLFLYFHNIYPTLAKLCTDEHLSSMSTASARYSNESGYHVSKLPSTIEALRSSPDFKNLSPREKMVCAIGILSKELKDLSLSQANIFSNFAKTTLAKTSLDDVGKHGYYGDNYDVDVPMAALNEVPQPVPAPETAESEIVVVEDKVAEATENEVAHPVPTPETTGAEIVVGEDKTAKTIDVVPHQEAAVVVPTTVSTIGVEQPTEDQSLQVVAREESDDTETSTLLEEKTVFHEVADEVLEDIRFSVLPQAPNASGIYNEYAFEEEQEFDNALAVLPADRPTPPAKIYIMDEDTPVETTDSITTFHSWVQDLTNPNAEKKTAEQYVAAIKSQSPSGGSEGTITAPVIESEEISDSHINEEPIAPEYEHEL